MQTATFVCRGRQLQSLYEDGFPYADFGRGGEVRISRNSRVDPIPGDGIRFRIEWLGRFRYMFGEFTTCDDDGNPFLTKAAAVAYEQLRLQRDYYKLPM